MNVPRIPSATMAPTERFWCAEHSGYPELYKEDICICLCRVYVISYRVRPLHVSQRHSSGGTVQTVTIPGANCATKYCTTSQSNNDRYYKAFCESASHPIPSGPRPGSDGLKDICHPPGSATLLSAPLALSSALLIPVSQAGRPSLIALITLSNKHCIFHCIESSMGISLKSPDCLSVFELALYSTMSLIEYRILALAHYLFSMETLLLITWCDMLKKSIFWCQIIAQSAHFWNTICL